MNLTSHSRGFLRKAMNSRQEVVVIAVDATDLIQEQMDRIQATPSAMIHLGQAMMSALLLQALGDPSEEDRVQAEWLCPGIFGHLYAEAMGTGRVRGTIGNPKASAELLGKDLGPGILQVRRAHSEVKSTGMVESQGRVGVDLVEYLEKSEQRACGSNLSVKIEWDATREHTPVPFKVRGAHGFLVHVLPDTAEAKRNEILRDWDAQILALGPISQWGLSESPPAATLETIQLLSREASPRLIFSRQTELYCTCSEERAARAVALLESVDKVVARSDPHTVRCEYCGSVYSVG